MRAVVRMGSYLWRPLTDSDVDTDFVVSLRNDDRFGKWFYQRVTRESHARFVKLAEERREINWVIERDGVPVGVSSIYNFDWTNRKAECGRIASLDPKVFHLNWVVSAHVAMDVVGTNKLYIETLEANSIIARAVERMGMVKEALLRAHVIRDGEPLNVLLFTNTNEEWQQMKRRHFEKFGAPEVLSYEGETMPRLAPAETSGAN
jgi:RimJ/RimL family protein N-acetyltransferase